MITPYLVSTRFIAVSPSLLPNFLEALRSTGSIVLYPTVAPAAPAAAAPISVLFLDKNFLALRTISLAPADFEIPFL